MRRLYVHPAPHTPIGESPSSSTLRHTHKTKTKKARKISSRYRQRRFNLARRQTQPLEFALIALQLSVISPLNKVALSADLQQAIDLAVAALPLPGSLSLCRASPACLGRHCGNPTQPGSLSLCRASPACLGRHCGNPTQPALVWGYISVETPPSPRLFWGCHCGNPPPTRPVGLAAMDRRKMTRGFNRDCVARATRRRV